MRELLLRIEVSGRSDKQMVLRRCPKVVILWFAAPEIISNRHHYDGKKADVWSAGVMLYVMLYCECVCSPLPVQNFPDRLSSVPLVCYSRLALLSGRQLFIATLLLLKFVRHGPFQSDIYGCPPCSQQDLLKHSTAGLQEIQWHARDICSSASACSGLLVADTPLSDLRTAKMTNDSRKFFSASCAWTTISHNPCRCQTGARIS